MGSSVLAVESASTVKKITRMCLRISHFGRQMKSQTRHAVATAAPSMWVPITACQATPKSSRTLTRGGSHSGAYEHFASTCGCLARQETQTICVARDTGDVNEDQILVDPAAAMLAAEIDEVVVP